MTKHTVGTARSGSWRARNCWKLDGGFGKPSTSQASSHGYDTRDLICRRICLTRRACALGGWVWQGWRLLRATNSPGSVTCLGRRWSLVRDSWYGGDRDLGSGLRASSSPPWERTLLCWGQQSRMGDVADKQPARRITCPAPARSRVRASAGKHLGVGGRDSLPGT